MERHDANNLDLGLPEFRIQERDWFKDSRTRFSDDMNLSERPQMQEMDKERMDANLRKLGQVLGKTKASWILDGALNISLIRGAYIGFHKDIDVSLEIEELDMLAKALVANDDDRYGLFHSYTSSGVKVMERVAPDLFKQDLRGKKRILAAIDARGKIKEEGALLFFEAHLIKRDAHDKPLTPWGSVMPEDWLKPQKRNFQGEVLHLSHPARIAYYKLYSAARSPYHRKDLELLLETKILTEKDIDDIERVVRTDATAYGEEQATELFDALLEIRKRILL